MRKIRIGTRKSKLALWQAHTVADLLRGVGADVELVEVSSQGDLDQTTPLNQFGQTGGVSLGKKQQSVQKDDPFAQLGL